MEFVKLFEDFLNENSMATAKRSEAFKFSWSRSNKSYGKMAIGHNTELRSWECKVHGEVIAWINNSGFLAGSLGGDGLDQWKVMFVSKIGSNITLAKRFEKDQIEDAKKWVEAVYTKIVNSGETSADKNLFPLKQKIYIPVKPVKGDRHFKGVIRKLKDVLGREFSFYFGTDNTNQSVRYHKDFDDTGTFYIYTRSKNPDEWVEKIKTALGDEFEVIGDNEKHTVQLKIKE